MLDLRWIRDNPDAFDRALVRRGIEAACRLRSSQHDQRLARRSRHRPSSFRPSATGSAKEIGAAKAKGGRRGATR